MKTMKTNTITIRIEKRFLLAAAFVLAGITSHAQSGTTATGNGSTQAAHVAGPDSVATVGANGNIYVVPANKAYSTQSTPDQRTGQPTGNPGAATPTATQAAGKPKE